MRERRSSIEHVMGNVPEEEKEQMLDQYEQNFDNQVGARLEQKERKKTPEEMRDVQYANEQTNELLAAFGIEPMDIPAENIHIVARDDWRASGANQEAYYYQKDQGVAIQEQIARVVTLKRMFHEMLHMKSHNARQMTAGKQNREEGYRVGLALTVRQGDKRYFSFLNEAMVEELTKRFIEAMEPGTDYSEDMQQTDEIMSAYPSVLQADGTELYDEDTYFVRADRAWFGKGKVKKIHAEKFSYSAERKMMRTLMEKLHEKNEDIYGSVEDVFDEFAQALLNGDLRTIMRDIEATFGKGTVKAIGELEVWPPERWNALSRDQKLNELGYQKKLQRVNKIIGKAEKEKALQKLADWVDEEDRKRQNGLEQFIESL